MKWRIKIVTLLSSFGDTFECFFYNIVLVLNGWHLPYGFHPVYVINGLPSQEFNMTVCQKDGIAWRVGG